MIYFSARRKWTDLKHRLHHQAGRAGQIQYFADGKLHLFFSCRAIPGNGLFYLSG